MAGLLTFMFGALGGLGEVAIGGAAAVVTTLLPGYVRRTRRLVCGSGFGLARPAACCRRATPRRR
jgi:hypothetical protein